MHNKNIFSKCGFPVLLVLVIAFLATFTPVRASKRSTIANPDLTSTPQPAENYAIPLWQPTVVSTPFLRLPPAPANHYRLTTWNMDKAVEALAVMKTSDGFSNPAQPDPYLTLLEESFSRFSELSSKDEMLVELANVRDINKSLQTNPILSEIFSGLSVWESLLQNALNQGEIHPDDLQNWVTWNMHPISMSVEVADNLYGDGKKVWAINVMKFNGTYQAVLLVKESEPGKYEVSALSGDEWEKVNRWNYELRVQDLNGNGIPEIIREKLIWWHFGITNTIKDLSIDEWDGHEFITLMNQSILIDDAHSNEEMNVWSYEKQADGTYMIVGRITTRTSDNCPSYTEFEYYLWTGHSFELQRTETDPLPETTSIACKVKWAYTAGSANPESIPILNDALLSWPTVLNDEIGPAAQDYFRLWLADAYATQGQPTTALQTLDDLISQPSNNKYTAILEMAKAYRKAYQSGGLYGACAAANEWRKSDSDTFLGKDHPYLDEDWQVEREHWGFGDDQEKYNFPCNFETSLAPLLVNQSFSTQSELLSWLSGQHIQWNGLKQADFNGDGKEDWLIVTRTSIHGENELWAFIQGEQQLHSFYLGSPKGALPNLKIGYAQYNPADGSNPVQLYHAGSEVVAFQMINKDDMVFPFVQINSNFSDESDPLQSMELSGNDFMIYSKNSTTLYQWNTNAARFTSIQNVSTDKPYTSYEEKLFINHDSEAIIEAAKHWQEPIDLPETDPMYDWEVYMKENSNTYHRYLLGLAYELQGDEKNALLTYWQLWYDFPNDPYALLARLKLNEQK